MKKRSFLCALILPGLLACQKPGEPASDARIDNPRKPNFVFIFADDQAPQTIAAYGKRELHTPNLDRLAQQGVNFRNAHNMGAWTGAVCLSSRTMLNSGLSLWDAYSIHDRYSHGEAYAEIWSKLLEKAGYSTYLTGKWHVAARASAVFQHLEHERPGMPRDAWNFDEQRTRFADLAAGKGPYHDWREFMPVGYNRPLGPDDTSWSPSDPSFGGFYEGGQHWSEVLRDDALKFIKEAQASDEPFFMYLAFNAPHDPRQAPQAYQDLYKAEDLRLPPSWQPEYPEKDWIGNGPQTRDAALAPFPRTEYATRVHLKEYYASISHLDAQIGDILDALEAAQLMDNTYIIYTADHGLAVGEHGLFGKQNMYEHSVRAPFIVLGPDMRGGRHVEANIYLQDAMATTLDLAGIPKPAHVFFNSVAGLARGTQTESVYPAIYGAYINSQRMIKKDGFKLIVYPEAKRLKLFNLREDPDETRDLSAQAEYQAKLHSLFEELVALQTQMNDRLDIRALAPKDKDRRS